ncbi:zinc-ribbon domain-containing protein [Ferruginibacter sp. SUN002]|uniref:zinc-ribbon domain-containing protein n=1 Tax=Ferruginibacter sp. SUN002 TaxID=2937789 RepID=UPI003D359D1B
MIVYGSKSKELLKEHIIDKCPHCGTQNSIDMYVLQKYAHVFWIPFFPMGKTGVSQCDHCKQMLKLKEMPPHLVTTYENLKAQTQTPKWMFSGLALVAFLITVGIISEKEKDEKNNKLILAPKKGDIFEVKIKALEYTLYKVHEVQKDSVFVQVNNYQINKVSKLDQLREKSYSEDIYGFSKTELKKMLDNDEILNIIRQ